MKPTTATILPTILRQSRRPSSLYRVRLTVPGLKVL